MRMVWASDQSLLVRELDDALGLFHALRRTLGEAPGVTDLSPARRSLLVRFDLRVTDHETVERWVRDASLDSQAPYVGKRVEIGVRYDGPDLAEVAAAAGLSVEEVVAMHSGVEYIAYFLGFAPGFAYLGDVPDALAVVGRRATPRIAVPAGSVGIAGKQTGVYPAALPGGWNLIGTTDAVMFDETSGTPLVEPGDRVRFIPL